MAADEELTTGYLGGPRETVRIMARGRRRWLPSKPSHRARALRKNRLTAQLVCSQIDVDESGDLEKAADIDAVK